MKRSHKQVGTAGETAVMRYLQQDAGFPDACRLAPAGEADCGDIGNMPDLIIQVKCHKAMALAAWVDASQKQAATARKPWAVVVHKRIRKGNPAEWYATLPLAQFAAIYRQALDR